MRTRDRRYQIIKPMLNDGKIKSFLEIFEFIPKSTVAADLGINSDRFNKLMKRIDWFTLDELFLLAKFCDLDERQMMELVFYDYYKSKSKIKRPGPPSEIP